MIKKELNKMEKMNQILKNIKIIEKAIKFNLPTKAIDMVTFLLRPCNEGGLPRKTDSRIIASLLIYHYLEKKSDYFEKIIPIIFVDRINNYKEKKKAVSNIKYKLKKYYHENFLKSLTDRGIYSKKDLISKFKEEVINYVEVLETKFSLRLRSSIMDYLDNFIKPPSKGGIKILNTTDPRDIAIVFSYYLSIIKNYKDLSIVDLIKVIFSEEINNSKANTKNSYIRAKKHRLLKYFKENFSIQIKEIDKKFNYNNEEINFFKDQKIDVKNLKSKWDWIYNDPSLVTKFYSDVICAINNKPPSDKELLNNLKYRGFKNAISKLDPPMSITDIRKVLGFHERTENTTSLHAHSKEIVAFLKNEYNVKPWRIEDYKNITSEEQLKIRTITRETMNYVLQKHPESLKFHKYSIQALKNLIKALPLILSEDNKEIVLFIQLYQLCYGKFNNIQGNEKFTKLIKLFYGKGRNKIPFQKRREEIYVFGKSFFNGLPYFNNFSFLEKKLNDYPDFLTYLKDANNMGTFPLNVLDDIRKGHEFQRISRFVRKLTNISKSHVEQRNIKHNFIKKLINEEKILIYSPNKDNPRLVESLMEFCQGKYYQKVVHSHGSPDHKYVLPKLLSKLQDNAIGIEIPVWMKSNEIYLTGHIDLMLFHDNSLIVADYKPDLTPELIKGKMNTSFLNSIPQVISYALLLKKAYNIDNITCVTFNKKGVWFYKPVVLLNEIRNFLLKNEKNKEQDRPWEKFFDEFVN